MSIGLDCIVEVKNIHTDKWEYFEPEGGYDTLEPFDYGPIALFTGFRNFGLMPVPKHWQYRGYPTDSDWLNSPSKRTIESNIPEDSYWYETNLTELRNDNDFAISHVTLQELTQFDYDVEYEDLYNEADRDTPLSAGQGRVTTIREEMGWSYFRCLDEMYSDTYDLTGGDDSRVRIIYNLS